MSEWIPPVEYVAKLPKSTIFANMFFTDTEGRVLHLRSSQPEHLERWQWPGGNLDDPSELPWDVARRECREETGIVFTGAPALLGVIAVLPRPHWPASHHGFVFDGGSLTDAELDAIVLDPAEHSGWEVRSLDEWRGELGCSRYDLAHMFLTARETRRPCYFEIRPEATA